MELRRGSFTRRAPAVLLVAIAVLIFAPSALAAGGTGSIAGTVISACKCEDYQPLKNVEVDAYEANGKEALVSQTLTNGEGKYVVEGLPAGEYKVEFSAEGRNFVTQFYEHKSSFSEAKPVKVLEGKTTEPIDAELEVGAEIEGTVTDAVTHKPVAEAFVVALGPGELFEGVAVTETNGHYTIMGLPTGSDRIEFSASGYVSQYYNGQSSFADANPVEALQEHTTAGINAELMPKAPIDTAPPVASGTLAVGQVLSCAPGTWTGVPAPSFSYLWLRNGIAIPGATASTYVIQNADLGKGLTCDVIAANTTGVATALSNTLVVPVPPPPPKPPPPKPKPKPKPAPKLRPVVTFLSFNLLVRRGVAGVPIACAHIQCTGTITLTKLLTVKYRRGGRTIYRKRTLALGRAVYAVAAGSRATVLVPLMAIGVKALARAPHHRTLVYVTAQVTGGASARESAILSQPVRHRRRHR